MTRDGLNAEMARQRQAELRRAAERHALAADAPARTRIAREDAQEAVTIRLAAADDGRELDSRRGRGSLRGLARLSRGLLQR
jgi:hypothetical protein